MDAITRALAATVLCLSPGFSFGQLSPVPYGQDTDGPEPTFSSALVSQVYPGVYASIRKVNFRDFRVIDFDKDGKPVEGFSLRNGHYKHDDPFDYQSFDDQSIDLEAVYYLANSAPAIRESALVLFSWFAAGGSSSQGGNAKVFTVSGGRLRVVQEIDWSTHSKGDQATESFDAKANVLVIRSDHYIPGDAHCRISAVDVVTFRWDGTHFAQAAIRTEPSEYGRREGKALPQR